MDVIGWFPRPSEVMRTAELWSGCVAGPLEKAEHEALLRSVGAERGLRGGLRRGHPHLRSEARLLRVLRRVRVSKALGEVPLASAFVRARKPVE